VSAPGAGLPLDPDLPADPTGLAPAVVAVVGAGGFVGALGRYELGLAWPTSAGHIPWSTFTINTSGAFLLGLVLTMLVRRGRHNHVFWHLFRPFFCVGALGAWTTMSTLAVEADLLVRSHRVATASVYTGATVVVGIAAASVGVVMGRWASP
jgi:CrcB protein